MESSIRKNYINSILVLLKSYYFFDIASVFDIVQNLSVRGFSNEMIPKSNVHKILKMSKNDWQKSIILTSFCLSMSTDWDDDILEHILKSTRDHSLNIVKNNLNANDIFEKFSSDINFQEDYIDFFCDCVLNKGNDCFPIFVGGKLLNRSYFEYNTLPRLNEKEKRIANDIISYRQELTPANNKKPIIYTFPTIKKD